MHILSFYTQQHCYALYPGGIRTRVFLFLRQMRCPLCHATRVFFLLIHQIDSMQAAIGHSITHALLSILIVLVVVLVVVVMVSSRFLFANKNDQIAKVRLD
jgi:hypothetical protein